MSEVHLARDLRLHRDVAVKVLRADLARDPSFYLRFRREAQNAAALNHPAIVAVYDTGEAETPTGPLPYIVMEYVDGVTLRDIVHTDGPMPPQRAIEVIADVCQALNFSHQHGIIHRDVKPANIMISKTGAVKVMDFGIARALADAGNRHPDRRGDRHRAVPVARAGPRRAVDARSDVYSLGCVLYEMLTGEPPFVGDSPVAVAYQHVREDPVPPSSDTAASRPELDAVVLKALAKNPDNRYQTAAEMRADLVRVHSGETPDAPKVLTDAERTSMLSAPSSRDRTQRIDPVGGRRPRYEERERSGSIGRWLAAVAVLAVLTVVVTIAINMIGGETRDVQVPDVRGQVSADAIAALQNRGFRTAPSRSPTPRAARPRHRHRPAANSSVAAGDEITINVSTGPEQREVPDVANLSYAEAVRRSSPTRGSASSSRPRRRRRPNRRTRCCAPCRRPTRPRRSPTRSRSSSAAGRRPPRCPTVVGQTVEVARQILTASGFTKTVPVEVDSTATGGQVIGTDPAAGQTVPLDTVIQLQVSRGNQFVMPDLSGQFWTDAEPRLRALGWTGVLDKGGDVQNSGQRTNAVVTQSPAAGTAVNFDCRITLSFAS